VGGGGEGRARSAKAVDFKQELERMGITAFPSKGISYLSFSLSLSKHAPIHDLFVCAK
jgi:hypothetical protein